MKVKSKKAKQTIPLVVMVILAGCATAPEAVREKSEQKEPDMPEWAFNPPIEEGYVYGMGVDTEKEKAALKAITDIAWQLSMQVNSVTVEKSTADSKTKGTIAASMGKQVSEATVDGAAIDREYESRSKEIWILARKNLDCVVDVAESVLIMYSLEMKMEDEDMGKLMEQAVQLAQMKRVENPGLESIEEVAVRVKAIVMGEEKVPEAESWEWAARKARSRISGKAPDGFVYVEGGTFTMGSPTSESGRDDVERQHQVSVSSFYISRYEVTQRQYREVMGRNPSRYKGNDRPVERVSWYDAVKFCNTLSQKEGYTPVYIINGNKVSWNRNANGYHLPTEAEWEYAARGGNKSRSYRYSGSNNVDNVGWYDGNSGVKTHNVGTKQANELGLYDMSGNVWEWCWDWYGDYSGGSQIDPTGPSSGSYRVLRGGSWGSYTGFVRVAIRSYNNPGQRIISNGFRLVLPAL